jgi:MFS family permease
VFGSLAVRSVAPHKALLGGALTFVVGVAGTITAVLTGSLALLFVAAVVTGFAFGASFFGAIAMITAGVAPGHRAGLLAATFVVGYLAFSLPAIAAGIAVPGIGLARATEIYGGVVIVLALIAVVSVTLRGRRSRQSAVAATDSEPIAA